MILVLKEEFIQKQLIELYQVELTLRRARLSNQLKKVIFLIMNKEALNQHSIPLVQLSLSIVLLMDLPLVSLQMQIKWPYWQLESLSTKSQWVWQLDQHLFPISKLYKINWQSLSLFSSFLLHQLVWVLELQLVKVIMTLHFWASSKLYLVEHLSILLVVTSWFMSSTAKNQTLHTKKMGKFYRRQKFKM